MKRNLLLLAVMVLVAFGFSSFAVADQDPNDNGVADTLYMECYPGDEELHEPGPWLVRVPLYVTNDIPDPNIDSIAGFVIPLCYTHTNPAKYCSLSAHWNNTELYPFSDLDRSIFRHFIEGEDTLIHNWMMDLSQQGMEEEWNCIALDVDGTSHFRLSLIPCGTADQHWPGGSRRLLATMTFKLEDTTTVCIDTCFWPPSWRLAFSRSDAVIYIPQIWDDYLGEEEYCFGTSMYAQCVTPPSGMTAWWPLDETSGPTASDIEGYANDGTWMNSPTPVNGKVAGALSFDGSNSVDVPDHTELNFGTGDFSIDLWIQTTDASGTRTVLDKRTGSLPNVTGYALYLWNGKPGLGLGDGAGYNNWTSTEFVADGIWHHVAATVDRDNSSGLLFYVDGNHVSTYDPTPRQGDLTNTAPFVMARNLIDPYYTFTGTLDEVELFNRVLDSLEVYFIRNADSLGKCKDTCYADGDANNDAFGLTTDDLAYLGEFIYACGPAPIPLYSCDLNGDGVVDPADLQLYSDYFVYGISVFDPYGGYPVLCPCNPVAEVEGPPTLICHFMTPEKESYPFDVTISDGDNLIEYDSVTYIETEVPLTFTMTLLYCVDEHCNFMEFPLTFSPCDTVEVEFYAVDPNTVQSRVRPYLVGKECGTEVNLNWDYDADSSTLYYSVVTEPTHRYAFVNTWIRAVEDRESDVYVLTGWAWLNAWFEITYWECTNGYDFRGYENLGKTLGEIWVPGRDNDSLAVRYEYAEVPAMMTPVGVTKVYDNVARIGEYTLTLSELDGTSYEPQGYYPQWTVSPTASYTLELAGMPQEYVGLKFPLTVPDSLENVILDLIPPRWEDLEPYSFSIGGGGFALWSSYSDFAYFPDDSLTVNVSIPVKYCDSWGCFVLPDSLTAQKVYAYSEDKSVDTLVSGADWLNNMRGEYNIVTVRSAPGVCRLKLIPGPYFVRGDVNGDELIDLGDVLYLISYLYKGGPEPDPLESGDCNCDGLVDLGDILYLISYLYKGGPPPEC